MRWTTQAFLTVIRSRGNSVRKVMLPRELALRPNILAAAAAIMLIAGTASQSSFAQLAPAAGPATPAPMVKASNANIGTLRVQLVREAAMSAAMRASLARQSEYINKMLDENARLLDDTYDFPSVMLPNSVTPPVIRKIERVTEQSGDVLRYSAAQFQIVKQAAFTTRPPTWRTYLPIPIWSDVGTTHPSLLPVNAEEKAAAQEGLSKGWAAGVGQANAMFMKGLTRLQNDWEGMTTYHALLKLNMVTAPIVNRQDMAVSGSSDSLVVDQSTYRIEAKPVFNPNISQWLALLDTTGASSFLEATKPKEAESTRAAVAAPSLNELMHTWGAK